MLTKLENCENDISIPILKLWLTSKVYFDLISDKNI